MTQPLLRIGTRRSRLALAQSGMMQRAIGRALGVPEAEIETLVPLVEIVTTGDRIQDRRLLEIGGKALFTKEIEEALLDSRVDVAVHSMKDVPAEQPPGLAIAAVPEREDPRDAFISDHYATFADLPQGARFGTASLRRQAQALALRPDLNIEMLRGNVDTRLKRLRDGDFDAILLACSGLNRLGLGEVIRQRLPLDAFLPAPGQGALALQTREGDVDAAWTRALNHAPTALAVAAERGHGRPGRLLPHRHRSLRPHRRRPSAPQHRNAQPRWVEPLDPFRRHRRRRRHGSRPRLGPRPRRSDPGRRRRPEDRALGP